MRHAILLGALFCFLFGPIEPASGAPLLAVGADATLESTLPIYAHNDYENDRPLLDALASGLRGVEVDLFLVGPDLLVGHDRRDLVERRTLRNLYLDPMKARFEEFGTICRDGKQFTLNIELKEEDPAAYERLHEELGAYEGMVTTVRGDVESSGAVRVVLVGWHPPLEALAQQAVRYAGVHMHFSDLPPDHARHPAHLLRTISVEYPKLFRWRGTRRTPPTSFHDRVQRVLAARDAEPGRMVRVFRVPRDRAVRRALWEAGVDLLGVKSSEIQGRGGLAGRRE